MTRGTIRTLFVEDEPDVREIVEVALGLDPEFDVSSFPSGEEALEALQGGTEHFDLALLDIGLPVLTGIELHRLLRCIPGMEDIRTVLITASLLPRDLEKCGSDDILGVIQKPFQAMRLATELRAMMERAA